MAKKLPSLEQQEFMIRTNSIVLGSDYTRSTLYAPDVSEVTIANWLVELDNDLRDVLSTLFQFSDFTSKYDVTSREVGSPMIYSRTTMPCKYTYQMEAFPALASNEASSNANKTVEELVFHKTFEYAIERYTKSGHKPNQVLRDTRSAKFCYQLALKVEAVPLKNAKKAHRMILLREFLILQHIWESYHSELMANNCGTDQLIGFPMPFEFSNVVGSEYDFIEESLGYTYYNVHGVQENVMNVSIPQTIPGSSTNIRSSLSYMSTEKLGPSLSYLLDLMRTQGRVFSVSSALKVYDQLLCRLLVMHRYGVVHCDLNTSSLFFGQGECHNVLYISEFGSAVLRPEANRHVPRFHDRFVSYLRFRDRNCHFVQDIESAFYVFIYLILGGLPWDSRIQDTSKNDEIGSTTANQPNNEPYTDRTRTVDDKEKFWQNQDMINRVYRLVDLEFYEPLYKSFSLDLLESLYSKTRESILTCNSIGTANYIKDCGISGSTVHNIYFGLRKIIATYFRFESLSPTLKDLQGTMKLEMLAKENPTDCRVAWDLSYWCWNHLDPKGQNQSLKRLSNIKL